MEEEGKGKRKGRDEGEGKEEKEEGRWSGCDRKKEEGDQKEAKRSVKR